MNVNDLQTPALLLDAEVLEHNVSLMASRLPGNRLRPHVKAHKCTALARYQRDTGGHGNFTTATIKETEGMARAGLGNDLLLANEVLDATRIRALLDDGHRVTLAVDSDETLDAAVSAGVREVVIDINVGLPRCGCSLEDSGRLAELARARGCLVRGVMGYEGHLMMVLSADEQRAKVESAMSILTAAHDRVGGELISAGGTGTHLVNVWANEIQAGSYALMDSAYAARDDGFRQALTILGSVIHTNRAKGFAVSDGGLKANGMDHGNPALPDYRVWFLSDEHVTFGLIDNPQPNDTQPNDPHSDRPYTDISKPIALPKVGDRIRIVPAHCDPTVAYHAAIWLVRGDEVLDRWSVDLRGW